MNKLLLDLKSRNGKRAKRAEEALKANLQPELLPHLLKLATGREPVAQDCAMNVVASFRDHTLIASFANKLLASKNSTQRLRGAYLMANAPQTHSLTKIKSLALNESREGVRILCIHALRTYAWNHPGSEKKFVSVWLEAIKSPKAGIRGAGYECLSHVRGTKYAAVVAKALQDPNKTIRVVSAPFWQKNGGRG